MSHFAKLDENNVVIFVTVGRQEDDGKEAELCARTGDRYVQTSYNTQAGVHMSGGIPFRKNFAAIGYTYDDQRDAFVPPKPFESWLLNEDTCQWEPPVPPPAVEEGFMAVWDEDVVNWDVIEINE